MHQLRHLRPQACLAGAWCNSSFVQSAVLEAVSLVTPALEVFLIRTVRDVARELPCAVLRSRADDFIREEASHRAAHRRLNAVLEIHLCGSPPALRWVEGLLGAATTRLSLARRLLFVEVLEHVTWLASAAYLRWEARVELECPYARRLFAQHAREEIGHACVIRALRPRPHSLGPLAWACAGVVVAAAGAAYMALAVPWVLLRKLHDTPPI